MKADELGVYRWGYSENLYGNPVGLWKSLKVFNWFFAGAVLLVQAGAIAAQNTIVVVDPYSGEVALYWTSTAYNSKGGCPVGFQGEFISIDSSTTKTDRNVGLPVRLVRNAE